MIRIVDRRAQRFVKYKRMVGRLGERASRASGLRMQDCIDEAEGCLALLLCEQWHRFDEARGAESTWITWQVRGHLGDFRKREQRRQITPLEDPDRLVKPDCWIERLWSELEDEGRKLLRVIFEAPGELASELWTVCLRKVGDDLDLCEVPQMHHLKRGGHRERVINHLRKNGWGEQKIEKAFHQVGECL